jgi:hypothetical protein
MDWGVDKTMAPTMIPCDILAPSDFMEHAPNDPILKWKDELKAQGNIFPTN